MVLCLARRKRAPTIDAYRRIGLLEEPGRPLPNDTVPQVPRVENPRGRKTPLQDTMDRL